MKKLLLCILLFTFSVFLLVGCKDSDGSGIGDTGDGLNIDTSFAAVDSEMFTDRDLRDAFDESLAVVIELSDSGTRCEDSNVRINEKSITITADGTYLIRGTLTNGSITVDAPTSAKPHLIFFEAHISAEGTAALCILESDKVILSLCEGTSNSLTSRGEFEGDDGVDGALFSRQDLSINGSGSLTVISEAGHGIVCKDDLVIAKSHVNLTTASHGIDANDSARLKAANLTVDAGKDGIHVENSDDADLGFIYLTDSSVNINSEGDGISASLSLQIQSGEFSITSGGGSENGTKVSSDSYGGFMGGRPGGYPSNSSETDTDSVSMKGLKAGGSILINGGSFQIDAADDAIHSNTSIVTANGNYNIKTGDDGFHADESLRITGGIVSITESYEGLEALNIEIAGGDITIKASDDGINAAGGNDSSGMGGARPGGDKFWGHGGFGGGSSSNGSITISGGKIYMNAAGDGIDANGSLTISGGHTTVCGPTSGDTSVLDYDNDAVITGGTFIGTGAYQMAQSFSDSGQGVIALRVGNCSAGTRIIMKDKDGNELINYVPSLSYQIVIISTPHMKKGESYVVEIGDNSGEFEAN